jgi:nucleoside-diphosphate-sugar epimerase
MTTTGNGSLGFVAGATGLTGRAVVSRLIAGGHGALAHVRPDSPRLEEWRGRFEALEGPAGTRAEVDVTPWEPAAMRARFEERRPAWVFACLGTTRARAKEAARAGRDPAAESYQAVDVALTELLIEAAREVGCVERFVYLSSIGAGGTGAENAYLAARTRVERTLRESGVPFSIARPSFILGERDQTRAGEKVVGGVADAGLSLLGALGARTTRDRYRSISGERLAAAMVAMAADPTWAGRVAQGEDLQRLAIG